MFDDFELHDIVHVGFGMIVVQVVVVDVEVVHAVAAVVDDNDCIHEDTQNQPVYFASHHRHLLD